jgi:hypothetical protein
MGNTCDRLDIVSHNLLRSAKPGNANVSALLFAYPPIQIYRQQQPVDG